MNSGEQQVGETSPPRKRTEAADSIYTAIRNDITHFVFRPGERLVETTLSERYGVSRTPIREALRRLEQEGLIILSDNGGRLVRHIDIDEYEDLYAMRIELECLAARQACERATPGEVAALRDEWKQGFEGDVPLDGSYAVANERFHSGIAELSRNRPLIEQLERIRARTRLVTLFDFTAQERIDATVREHDEILDAMVERDVLTATTLLREHISESRESIREMVERALGRIYATGGSAVADRPQGSRLGT